MKAMYWGITIERAGSSTASVALAGIRFYDENLILQTPLEVIVRDAWAFNGGNGGLSFFDVLTDNLLSTSWYTDGAPETTGGKFIAFRFATPFVCGRVETAGHANVTAPQSYSILGSLFGAHWVQVGQVHGSIGGNSWSAADTQLVVGAPTLPILNPSRESSVLGAHHYRANVIVANKDANTARIYSYRFSGPLFVGSNTRQDYGASFHYRSDNPTVVSSIGGFDQSSGTNRYTDQIYFGESKRNISAHGSAFGAGNWLRAGIDNLRISSDTNETPRTMAFEWSNDGFLYKTAAILALNNTWPNPGGWADKDFTLTPAVGVMAPFKMFRLVFTQYSEPDVKQVIGLQKVEMAATIAGPNLCTGGTPRVSSGVASDAFASGPDWATTTAEDVPYIQYSFSTPLVIREIRLVKGTVQAPYAGYLLGSDNGVSWFKLNDFYGFSYPSGVQAIDIQDPSLVVGANVDTQYRQIRLSLSGPLSDQYRSRTTNQIALQAIQFKDASGNFVTPVSFRPLRGRGELQVPEFGGRFAPNSDVATLFNGDTTTPGDYYGDAGKLSGGFFENRIGGRWPSQPGCARFASGGAGYGSPVIGHRDFTWEAWVYPINGGRGSTHARLCQFGTLYAPTSGGGVTFYLPGSGTTAQAVSLGIGGLANPCLTSLSTLPNNTWTHVAFQRRGRVWSIWINGFKDIELDVPNAARFDNIRDISQYAIGANTSGGETFNGHMDQVRLTGAARYSATFTPEASFPTDTTDPLWDLVISFLSCDPAPSSWGFNDLKGKTITYVGSPAPYATREQVKVLPRSILFNGTNAYLRCDPVAAGLVAATEFTAEGWFYRFRNPVGGQETLFGFHSSAGANTMVVCPTVIFGDAFSTLSGTFAKVGEWTHVALVRRTDRYQVWVNGVKVYESLGGSHGLVASSLFSIGQEWDAGPTASDFFMGDCGAFRVTNVARYTTPFTPPVTEWDATDPLWANVIFCIGQTTTSAPLTTIQDLKANAWLASASATLSTAVTPKSGTHTLYFPGTGTSRVYYTGTNTLDMGLLDHTIETWFYAHTTHRRVHSALTYQDNPLYSQRCYIIQNDNEGPQYWSYNGSSSLMVPNGLAHWARNTQQPDRWMHLSYNRRGGVYFTCLDGVIVAWDNARMTTPVGGQAAWRLCGDPEPVNGLLQDFRITKGTCRMGPVDHVLTTPDLVPSPANDPDFGDVIFQFTGEHGDAMSTFEETGAKTSGGIWGNNTSIGTNGPQPGEGYYLRTNNTTSAGVRWDSGFPSQAFALTNSGDWCFEFWFRVPVLQSSAIYQFMSLGTDTTNSLRLMYHSAGHMYLKTASTDMFTNITFAANTWTHVAVVSEGGVGRVFKNGVYTTSATLIAGIVSDSLTVGYSSAFSSWSQWAIDFAQIRITKGHSRYSGTTSFTPEYFLPLVDDPLKDFVRFLLRCEKSLLTKNNPRRLTLAPAARISCLKRTLIENTGVSLIAGGAFNAGSASFDGIGQFLTLTPTAAHKPSGDFYYDAWIYPTVIQAGSNWPNDPTLWHTIYSCGDTSTTGHALSIGGTQIAFTVGAATIVTATSNLALTAWTHVAISRLGDVFSLYVAGVRVAQATAAAIDLVTNFGPSIRVGRAWSTSFFTGRMNDVRAIVGWGTSDATLTLNTQHSLQDKRDPLWAYTQISLHLTNAVLTYDALGHEMATSGFDFSDFTYYSANCFYSNNTILFNSTNDYFEPKNYGDWAFGRGDFEITFMIRHNASNHHIVGNYNPNIAGTWALYIDAAGALHFSVVAPSTEGGFITASIDGAYSNTGWFFTRVGRKDGLVYGLVGSRIAFINHGCTAEMICTESTPIRIGRRSEVTPSPLWRGSSVSPWGNTLAMESFTVYKKSRWQHSWLPTGPLPEGPTLDPLWDDVELLLHFDQGQYRADGNLRRIFKDSSKRGILPSFDATARTQETLLEIEVDFGKAVKLREMIVTLPVADLPEREATGLTSWWYNGANFDTFVGHVSGWSPANSNWTSTNPYLVTSDAFSIIARGWLIGPVTGPVTFRFYADDYFRVLIGGYFSSLNYGEYLVNYWSTSGIATVTIDMVAGQAYPFEYHYKDTGGNAAQWIYWSYYGSPEAPIPVGFFRQDDWIPPSGACNPAMISLRPSAPTHQYHYTDNSSVFATMRIPHRNFSSGAQLSIPLHHQHSVTPGQHRFWRVVFVEGNGSTAELDYAAVGLFESDGAPAFQFLGAAAVSSELTAGHMFAGFYGSPVYAYHRSRAGAYMGQWLAYSLLKPRKPTRFSIGAFWSVPSHWDWLPTVVDIQWSDDGITWITRNVLNISWGPRPPSGRTEEHTHVLRTFSLSENGASREIDWSFTDLTRYSHPSATVPEFSGKDIELEGHRRGVAGLNTDRPSGPAGRISGQINQVGNPVARRVVLLDQASLAPLMSVWSDSAGQYAFEGVDLTASYLVIAQDYNRIYNAVVQDVVSPEKMQ